MEIPTSFNNDPWDWLYGEAHLKLQGWVNCSLGTQQQFYLEFAQQSTLYRASLFSLFCRFMASFMVSGVSPCLFLTNKPEALLLTDSKFVGNRNMFLAFFSLSLWQKCSNQSNFREKGFILAHGLRHSPSCWGSQGCRSLKQLILWHLQPVTENDDHLWSAHFLYSMHSRVLWPGNSPMHN